MKMSYLPVPEGCDVTNTVQVEQYQGCDEDQYVTVDAVASVLVEPSTTEREYVPITEHSSVYRPTDGNWTQIRKSGAIKMTPMHNTHELIVDQLGSVEHHVADIDHKWLGHHTTRIGGVCTPCSVVDAAQGVAVAEATYIEQGDLTYWREVLPGVETYVPTNPNKGIDPAAVSRAQSSAFAELYNGFDLGEELAEARQTMMTIQSLVRRGTELVFRFKSLYQSLLKQGNTKGAAKAWLEFRYAIMPIVYSIQDAADLLQSEGEYQTVRRSVHAKPHVTMKSADDIYFWQEVQDSSVAHITVKGRWSSPQVKKLDRINVNALTTVARVYPWMMVVRWFINVNSWLETLVKSRTSMALSVAGCVGYRIVVTRTTHLHYSGSSVTTISGSLNSGTCGTEYYGTYGPHTAGRAYESECLLRTEATDSYVRVLFSPNDVNLVWHANLEDWKRFLDGFALSTGASSNLLRKGL